MKLPFIRIKRNLFTSTDEGRRYLIKTGKPSCRSGKCATVYTYSSCCSTDPQHHPRSMLFISSEKAYAISY